MCERITQNQRSRFKTAADDVGLSKNHLSQGFPRDHWHKVLGLCNAVAYRKGERTAQESNRSNYEICRAIGYQSEFYFSKIFKRVVGIAAQEFRRL